MRKTKLHWLKRLMALTLTMALFLQVLPVGAIADAINGAKQSSFTPGDVNDDGLINALDVNLLRRHIVGGYDVTINLFAADVSDDGAVDAKDVNVLRRYIAGGYGVELNP